MADRDEFTAPQERAYFQFNASTVRRRWRDDFSASGPLPYYICENCYFVGNRRADFQLDHIKPCAGGGTADRGTQQDQDRLNEGDLVLAYEVGINGMVLCTGCNQAKKTRPFIPPGSGYAYTMRHRDRNPDHIYNGGPPPVSKKEIEEYPEVPSGTWLRRLRRLGFLS